MKVDLRTRSFDVPEQEILTRDSVTVVVDAVVYYKISNPLASVIKVMLQISTYTSLMYSMISRKMVVNSSATIFLSGDFGADKFSPFPIPGAFHVFFFR